MKKNSYIILFFIISKGINAQFMPSYFPETISRMNSMCFYNSKIFLANGDPNTLFTKDGGKIFTKVASSGNYNNAVALNDSTFIITLNVRLKITKNQGKSWNDKILINYNGDTIKNSDMYDFYIFNNGKGFLTNYIQKKKPQVYVTKNWGETWDLLDSIKNNFTTRDNKSNSFSKKQYNFDSTSYVMKQSSDSILVKYSNYGENVSEINLAVKGIIQKVLSISFKDENNGMILTSYSSTETQKIYITSDGCKTFTEINKPNENFQKIEYAKATNNKEAFYIACFITSVTAGTGGSYYTKDNGKSWYKNLDNNYLRSLDFYDAETGIVTIGRDVNFKTNIFYFTGNTTNISEINKLSNNITLYPNPSINNLNIEGINGNFNFKIINLVGQVVLSGSIKNIDNTIDISTLKPSTYLINLETESGSKMYKFIKIAY